MQASMPCGAGGGAGPSPLSPPMTWVSSLHALGWWGPERRGSVVGGWERVELGGAHLSGGEQRVHFFLPPTEAGDRRGSYVVYRIVQ